MTVHDLALAVRQASLLDQDVERNADLADVVQQARDAVARESPRRSIPATPASAIVSTDTLSECVVVYSSNPRS